MTRKKSRPTHRENAAAAPSNELRFYKMFWNSMDTNHGTNGPNSPSQMDVTSPPVIIVNDSPAGSPCGDGNVEDVVVPLPIKEEIREVDKTQNSSFEPVMDFQESHIEGINGECALPLPTCLPGNPLTSPSKISTTSPSQQKDLSSVENPSQAIVCADVTATVESNEVSESGEVLSGENPTVGSPSREHQDGAEDGGSTGENQVGSVPSEDDKMLPEASSKPTVDSVDGLGVSPNGRNSLCDPELPEETPCGAPQPSSGSVDSSGEDLGKAPGFDGMSSKTNVSNEILTEPCDESPSEMDVAPPTPPPLHEIPEELYDASFSAVDVNADAPPEAIQPPQSPTSFQILNLLSCVLNADEDELENITRDVDLCGTNTDGCNEPSDSDMHADWDGAEPDNNIPNDTEVSGIDQITASPENNHIGTLSDANQLVESNKTVVEDTEDEFPTLNNFLPKKIKIDTIGVMRSVRVLKDELRALYKEYLRDDVLLRTSNAPPPVERPSSPEVEETPSFPPINVYPICCVKMERLPDPFVKKSSITMSDHTFRTWKRQITRQRNEEKFRHLKVWRRGRMLLWRECELAGMDRATYDEQVAYVNKHKVSETSSSGNDSSGEEGASDAFSGHFSSSGESSEDEQGSLEGSSVDTSPSKSVSTFPQVGLNLANVNSMLGEEYVVERNSNNQTSPAKTPSALKITLRKTSTGKSEEDKEKTTDSESNFTVPTQPTYKPRKVATKRTFRRPDDTKSHRPKTTVPDLKKSKTPSAEPEYLYDQSLLGTRRDEVENFNLLEKWDIPFEAPTLFRSPRVASKLAQLKTKEAFAPSKKHVAKTTVVSAVSKEVKDVVEMLCSKTVEAMLFPSKSTGSMKLAKTNDVVGAVDSEDSSVSVQQIDVPCKPGLAREETSSALDESSEISLSETNSTIDASSDFGGSAASLVSDDLPPPKKSPQKPRKRRRFGFGKKKSKGNAPGEPPVVGGSHEGDEACADKTDAGNDGSSPKPVSSPAHSTQVPVVSEGPGQSPYESEDDSTLKAKYHSSSKLSPSIDDSAERRSLEGPNQLPAPPLETQKETTRTAKKTQQEPIPPRLTRSKQPSIELDKELLENFGSRKRKSVANAPSNKGKKSKPEVPKTPLGSKTRSRAPGKQPASKGPDDHSNTQVPEVTEGPGEVSLDSEARRDQDIKNESQAGKGRVLRSRSRLSCPDASPTEMSLNEKPQQTGKDQNDILEAPLELESPQSPPPETVEPLMNNRVTRSKKRRSGPAYVCLPVKTTTSDELPSVSQVVDSIAGHRLPTLNSLFDTPVNAPNEASEPPASFSASNVDTPCVDKGSAPVNELRRENDVRAESAGEKTDETPKESSAELSQNWTQSDLPIPGNEPRNEAVATHTASDSLGKALVDNTNLSSELNESAADTLNSKVRSNLKDDNLKSPTGIGVGSGRLEVLDIVNNERDIVLAVSSPKKGSETASAPSPSPANTVLQEFSGPSITPSLPSTVSNPSLTSLNPSTAQDITSILPGTLLPSLPGNLLPALPDLRNTLDTDLVALGTDMEDSTIISPWADSPGDLVVDDDEELNTNTTTLDALNDFIKDSALDAFSDDETNNTDLTDKIDKIILDQMHQDASPIPSLKPKATDGSKGVQEPDQEDETSKSDTVKSARGLARRDSIDERTGLPNTLIQRLRDPRIRSRLLSHLEEVETLPQGNSPSVPGQTNPSEDILAGDKPAAVPQESRVVEPAVSSAVTTLPQSALVASQTCETQAVVTSSVAPSTPVSAQQATLTAPIQAPVRPVTPLLPPTESVDPEEPPDPSKVDFLVPPSDDEEEESIKRRPKKAKKEIDVELMYKSPLEDLQSEARSGYGDRGPRRYADNFPRRRIGDPRPRWDERRSRRDERDSRPSLDHSRDRRFDPDRRFYDRPPRDHSRDSRFDERYARDEHEGHYPLDRPFNHS